MTMRIDILTNDAGELVRREHARELGAGVVVAIYRLVKVAQMHDLGNQAFVRQLDQTYQMIGDYVLRSGSAVNVLFANKATFVAGQLLKGNRGAYEAATELGALLERIGGSDLTVFREVTREDLHHFAEQISIFHRSNNASILKFPQTIVLRTVTDAARLRGIELEDLTPDQRIVRAYSSAVVIMRRFYEDLAASRYILPRRIKRIAQSLVDLSDAKTTSFLGVTEVRNANHDEPGRAVNTAVLAVAIARESTEDRATLAQIAMAAMMHDVARPRALALAGVGAESVDGIAGPSTLSEDQEDRLPAGAAAVLTALGRVNEPSIMRTVVTFESLWLRRQTWLGPVYWGERPASLHATIIAVARRYNDLLTPEPGLQPPTTDYAVAMLAEELTEPIDRMVLRMLVSALGLLPVGTTVRLATGEVAEVVRGAKGVGDQARVVLLTAANGTPYAQPTEIELADDPARRVVRILGVDGWRKGLAAGPPVHQDIPDELLDDEQPYAVEAEPEYPDAYGHDAHLADPSGGSFGSTPSAVAKAMGRMPAESSVLAAAEESAPDEPDHTVIESETPQAPSAKAERSDDATARGTLEATPLPHVLVYLLDQALTGSVVFTQPDGHVGEDDTIYVVNGVATKIRLRDSVAFLGEVLVAEKLIDPRLVDAAAEQARRAGRPLGEYLVSEELVSAECVAWALQVQLLQKIGHIANLAPTTQYAFYRDVDMLHGWGSSIRLSHPLNPIVASVRAWSDRRRLRATLDRIGDHPLRIHPDADLANLLLSAEEQAAVTALRAQPTTVAELLETFAVSADSVASLVYAFAVSRQFEFEGQPKPPMASRRTRAHLGPTAPAAPPAVRPAPPSPAQRVARASSAPKPLAARPAGPQIRPISQRAPNVNPPASRVAKPASPRSPAVLVRLAEEASARGELGLAEMHAKAALDGDPKLVDAMVVVAWVRGIGSDAKVTETSVRALSKILLEDPSNEKALFYRAKLLQRTNRLPEALNDFNELLAVNPAHAEAKAAATELTTKLAST